MAKSDKKKEKEYWQRRYKQTQDAIKDGAFKEAAAIEREYTAVMKDIDTKIRAWYQRLAVNNELKYADAVKLLKKDELEEFHWTVQEYIKHGTDNLDGKWSKQLENASARVHISRLEALKIELQGHAEELTGKLIAATTEAAEEAFTASYYHTAYELQHVAGVGVDMHQIDKRRLESVLSKPWTADNKTFKARCWTDKDKLVDLLGRELTRMAATGAKPDRAIKNISKAFETSRSNAARLVMTESAYFASEAERECYTDLNVERYEVLGTFDTKMCDYCADMDGKVFPLEEFKEGDTAPPFHPWCRCCTAPYYEDMKGLGERAMRDPESGKGGYVPRDMTYQEWKEIYVDKTSTMDEWNAKHVDKSAESGRIGTGLPVNIQLFAKKSSDFKTVWLPKNEYAHVMREIGTNITEKQRSMNTFSKPIGNYVYTVENKGFGDYRVIRKRRIK